MNIPFILMVISQILFFVGVGFFISIIVRMFKTSPGLGICGMVIPLFMPFWAFTKGSKSDRKSFWIGLIIFIIAATIFFTQAPKVVNAIK